MDGGDIPAGSEEAPRLRLDELLSQLIERAQETLGTQERLRGLLQANQSIIGNLDLPTVLRRIVEAASELVGARYAALGVIAADGSGLSEFVHVGIPEDDVARIGHLPEGKGLLGALIDDPYPIRLNHLHEDIRSTGFPEGHPPMDSFLGVPVRVRDEIFGNLYLTNARAGTFTHDDEALALSLAATAGVAIENARLYHQSRRRQDWLHASAEVTRQILAVADQTSLQTVVETARRLSDADLVALVVPGEDPDRVTVTAAAGERAQAILGRAFPSPGTMSETVFATGQAMLVENAARDVEGPHVPLVGALGPVMLLPLIGSQGSAGVRGVLVTGRRPGRRRFTEGDLEMSTTFATHASLALELAEARQDQQRMVVLEDRARIARDLHDHVIQQLFAAGMTVQGVSTGLGQGPAAETLDKVVDTLDDAIKQIRTSIFQLQPHRSATSSLRVAVLNVVAELVPALAFEPHVSFDGPVDAVSDEALTEDVLAVVREALSNIAKHAQASRVTVRVRADPTHLEVTVEDDGTGIRATHRTSGLANLRERADSRGGRLMLSPCHRETGTVLRWHVPLS